MPLNTATRIAVCYQYKQRIDAKRELAPALRPQVWQLIAEFSTRMHKHGRWATARYMAKRGFPIELALAAVYAGN